MMAQMLTETKPSTRLGKQTVSFGSPPVISGFASVVGPKEGEGPFGKLFDVIEPDVLLGEKSWERAETKLMIKASKLALKRAGLSAGDLDYMLAGDLLNQIIASDFAARELAAPFLGLYGACSTIAEGLGIASSLISGGIARQVLVTVSSHFNTAERQYRYPLEFGAQRPVTSQWTVTGAGAVVLTAETGVGDGHDGHPRITSWTCGRVVDMGISNPNDMGSAMAPAAADTIQQHLEDTERGPDDYDLIITGDLGKLGSKLVDEVLAKKGIRLGDNFTDCGAIIFGEDQDVHSGASGPACSAAMLGGPLLKRMVAGELRRLLFVPTGALFSPTSFQQGESIPSIAHAIVIEGPDGKAGRRS